MIKRSSPWLEGLYSRGAIYTVVLRICISCGLVINSSEFDFCFIYIDVHNAGPLKTATEKGPKFNLI
jgi:hypothetical protein